MIERHTYRSFAVAVVNEDFSAVPKNLKIETQIGNPFSFAARACLAQIREWLLKERMKNIPVEYVFEDGDKGQGILMEIMKRDGYAVPIFKKKDEMPQLQPADLLAYEIRVQSISEWPFDLPTLRRFGFYLMIPLASMVGGAFVERIVDAVID